MIRVSIFSNDLMTRVMPGGWQGLVYIDQSIHREPLDQTDLKDGVDATQEAVENRHYDVEADSVPKSYTSGVIPTHVVVSIKNEKFKPKPSTPMQAFASMRSIPFMEIDDKEGEIVQRYESFGRD